NERGGRNQQRTAERLRHDLPSIQRARADAHRSKALHEEPLMKLLWKKIAPGIYHATSPRGLYTIDGHAAGRNRWRVTNPDGDYGMVDALAEAKAWAAQEAGTRESRTNSTHAQKRGQRRVQRRGSGRRKRIRSRELGACEFELAT